MPASSAMRASLTLSDHAADQRSCTKVTARPDEQLAPNRPILSALPLYMAVRCCMEAATSHDRLKALAPDQAQQFQRSAARPFCAALKLTHIVCRHVQAPRQDRLAHTRPFAQRLNVL